jgi:(1->4)-alpha-D-glucan 1-alpha-D-glucosylmutase
MAKGVEDTAFYCFNRFLALNEVGCSPDRFGGALEDFHRASADSSARWPHAMLATSTHDTKRSEDVRSRLAVLSEIPTEWFAAVRRWSAMTERYRQGETPDRNAVYHYFQILVGAWPLEVERAIEYMRKAAREAKQHTSWTEVSPKYEAVLLEFVRATLADPEFVADLDGFVRSIAPAGSLNALAETVLKLTAPGVPDVYQGTELWDFHLVDPDNRRPVDFAQRRSVLAQIQEGLACESRAAYAQKLLHASGGGELKLYLIQQTLGFRRSQARLFAGGSYQPLLLEGDYSRHACAFGRIHSDGALLVLVPRLTYRLCAERGAPWPLGPQFWQNTRLVLSGALKDRQFRNLYTDEVVVGHKEGGKAALPLGDVLNTLPVAVLEVLPGA